MKRPRDGKLAGCAIVELQCEDDAIRAMEFDGTELLGRKMYMCRDDNDHRAIRTFCNKMGIGFIIDGKSGRPELCEKDQERMLSNQHNNDRHSSNTGGNVMSNVPVIQANFQGPRRPDGLPLINAMPDLLRSTVVVGNLPFSVNDRELMDLMRKCGHVEKVELLYNKETDERHPGKFRGIWCGWFKFFSSIFSIFSNFKFLCIKQQSYQQPVSLKLPSHSSY